jgi:hypothetical protein
MHQKLPSVCGQLYCRVHHLTVKEFERLGGETWSQSFRIRLGRRAKEIYSQAYRKEPKKVRSLPFRPNYKSKVNQFPCGIIEQAYRELIAEGAQAGADRTAA